MEIAIPLVALGSLFVMSNSSGQQRSGGERGEVEETFDNLPNTDLLDQNYLSTSTSTSTPDDNIPSTGNPHELSYYHSPNQYTDRYFLSKQEQSSQNKQYGEDELFYSLSGKQMTLNDDTLNKFLTNSQPFYGSSAPNYNLPGLSETILDAYSGQGSNAISKTESGPLFNNQDKNIHWTNGMPNTSDFRQDRMMGNLGHKMHNVKPWEETRETPGTNGFNYGQENRDQWRDKTVDELRVATNPKSTYMFVGHEGAAKSVSTNRGVHAQVEKNNVDRHYDMGPDRWFTTTGQGGEAATLRANQPYKNVNRATTDENSSYEGVAAATAGKDATYVMGEYMDSTRVQLDGGNLGITAAAGRNFAKPGEHGLDALNVNTNNRVTTSQPQSDAWGIVGGVIGAVVSPLMDVLRPSRKENVIGNLRQFESGVRGPQQTYTFNPADRMAPTMRETYESSTYQWNSQPAIQQGAFTVAQQNTVANNTFRQDQHVSYGGSAGAGYSMKPKSYGADYAFAQETANPYKETTLQGRINHGNRSVLNTDQHMTTSKWESDRHNNRMWVPQRQTVIPSGIAQMGTVPTFEEQVVNQRNNPDILAAFKNNPYTQSMMINDPTGYGPARSHV